jgi:hypothetical protein
MAATENSDAKKPPKGGRKGGTLFPKINLKQALDYAKKVVSKTHTGPQPEKTILPGVFKNAGPLGKVRASALKQYGLLEGKSDAYTATKLAKDIGAAPEEERGPLLQQALLTSKPFKQVFETFHDDTVSKAKIEQRAKGLDVHPDSAAEFAQLFIDSAVTAGLGTLTGDSIALVKAGSVPSTDARTTKEETQDKIEAQERESSHGVHEREKPIDGKDMKSLRSEIKQGARPGVTLALTVDPSSDPDKLEKQLRLLRQYGMI